MSDDDIIEMLFARFEKSIEEIDKKYGKKCRRMALEILGNEQDAEECVNDAYLAVWNKVPPERPDPFSTFLYRILKNVSFKKKRSNERQKRKCIYEQATEEMAETLASSETVESALESKEIEKIVNEFLASLTLNNRVAFVRRYWYLENCNEIAKSLGLSEKNVTVMLTRTRKKLKSYLEERGVEL